MHHDPKNIVTVEEIENGKLRIQFAVEYASSLQAHLKKNRVRHTSPIEIVGSYAYVRQNGKLKIKEWPVVYEIEAKGKQDDFWKWVDGWDP